MVTLRPKTKTDRREGRIAFRLFNIQGKKTQRQKIPAGGRNVKCSDHFLLQSARGSHRGNLFQRCGAPPTPIILSGHLLFWISGQKKAENIFAAEQRPERSRCPFLSA